MEALLELQEQRHKKRRHDTNLRLPQRVYLDFSPNGTLCDVFRTIYRYTFENQLESISLDDDLAVLVDHNIISNGYYQLPICFFASNVNQESREQMTEFLSKFGKVTENEDEATHIIFAPLNRSLSIDKSACGIFKAGNSTLLHWCYCPDSENVWLKQKFCSLVTIYITIICTTV